MTSRRFVFVVVLGVLLVGALIAGRASSTPAPRPPTETSAHTAAVTGADPVWFCPGLPPALPSRSARVTFSNIGSESADIAVTDLLDKGNPTHLSLTLPARTVVTRTRDSLGGPGALTIETFGGRVLVEEGIEGVRALETTACATQTSTRWYLGAGTTPRGVEQWLVIDNPYASDARVNVTLRTNTGVLQPDALQGLAVVRRSRTIVPIHDSAVRKSRVSVEVAADLGSVVAAQTLVYTAAAGTPGVALALGSPMPASDWIFAGAAAQPNSTAVVAITNVSQDNAQVDVQAIGVSPKTTLTPAAVTVPPDAVVWVALGQCTSTPTGPPCVPIPNGTHYSLEVRSDLNVGIVAQTLTRFAAPDVTGTVTSGGGTLASRSWAFGRSRVRGERSTTVSLFNPGAVSAVANIGLVHDGKVDRPLRLQSVRVPPGRSVTLSVVGGPRPAASDAALTIDASAPILVARSIYATDEAADSAGVVNG